MTSQSGFDKMFINQDPLMKLNPIQNIRSINIMTIQNKTNMYKNAEEIIKRIEVMKDIINNGVSCNKTHNELWFKESWNGVHSAIQFAAKEQAQKELEKLKNELAVFIQIV